MQPSIQPVASPTSLPSRQPTNIPSRQPSRQPSSHPTKQPLSTPSSIPSKQPFNTPSSQPTMQPTNQPTLQPVMYPSAQPSYQPSSQPTSQPIVLPTRQPTVQPTLKPTAQPTMIPTNLPTMQPTLVPTQQPSISPSSQPTSQPIIKPSMQPSSLPTFQPSRQPSSQPTMQPSIQPASMPSVQPSIQPSSKPSAQPIMFPTSIPTMQPIMLPTQQPSVNPTSQPTSQPIIKPSMQPSIQPTMQPSKQPTMQPSSQPSSRPSELDIIWKIRVNNNNDNILNNLDINFGKMPFLQFYDKINEYCTNDFWETQTWKSNCTLRVALYYCLYRFPWSRQSAKYGNLQSDQVCLIKVPPRSITHFESKFIFNDYYNSRIKSMSKVRRQNLNITIDFSYSTLIVEDQFHIKFQSNEDNVIYFKIINANINLTTSGPKLGKSPSILISNCESILLKNINSNRVPVFIESSKSFEAYNYNAFNFSSRNVIISSIIYPIKPEGQLARRALDIHNVSEVHIISSLFQNCTGANYGAALSVSNAKFLLIKKSNFSNNVANYGPAISLSSVLESEISDNEFENNHAFISGGSIFWTFFQGKSTNNLPILTNNTFINSKAEEYGDIIASSFAKLQASVTFIRYNDYTTVLINKTITFLTLDAHDNVIPLSNYLTWSPSTDFSDCFTNVPKVLGFSSQALVNGMTSVSGIGLSCYPGGTLALEFTLKSLRVPIDLYDNVRSIIPETTIEVYYRRCVVGEIFDSKSLTQSTCSPCINSYSMKQNTNEFATKCTSCPLGAICYLNKVILPKGTWSFQRNSTKIFICSVTEACLGETVGDASCAKGYHGPYCGVCESGYYLLEDNTCSSCKVSYETLLLTVSFAILMFIIGKIKDKIEDYIDSHIIGLINIFIKSSQIIQQTMVINMGSILSTLMKIGSLDILGLAFLKCFFNYNYLTIVAAYTILPVVGLIIMLVLIYMTNNINIYQYFVLFIYFASTEISSKIYKMYNCVDLDPYNEISSTPGEFTYLIEDLSISCTSEEYKFMKKMSYLMVMVYPVGLPLVVVMFLFKVEGLIQRPEILNKIKRAVRNGVKLSDKIYLFMEPMAIYYSRYKKTRWFFEITDMVTLTAILYCNTLDADKQFLCVFVVVVLRSHLQETLQPYSMKAENTLASIGKTTHIIIAFINVITNYNLVETSSIFSLHGLRSSELNKINNILKQSITVILNIFLLSFLMITASYSFKLYQSKMNNKKEIHELELHDDSEEFWIYCRYFQDGDHYDTTKMSIAVHKTQAQMKDLTRVLGIFFLSLTSRHKLRTNREVRNTHRTSIYSGDFRNNLLFLGGAANLQHRLADLVLLDSDIWKDSQNVIIMSYNIEKSQKNIYLNQHYLRYRAIWSKFHKASLHSTASIELAREHLRSRHNAILSHSFLRATKPSSSTSSSSTDISNSFDQFSIDILDGSEAEQTDTELVHSLKYLKDSLSIDDSQILDSSDDKKVKVVFDIKSNDFKSGITNKSNQKAGRIIPTSSSKQKSPNIGPKHKLSAGIRTVVNTLAMKNTSKRDVVSPREKRNEVGEDKGLPSERTVISKKMQPANVKSPPEVGIKYLNRFKQTYKTSKLWGRVSNKKSSFVPEKSKSAVDAVIQKAKKERISEISSTKIFDISQTGLNIETETSSPATYPQLYTPTAIDAPQYNGNHTSQNDTNGIEGITDNIKPSKFIFAPRVLKKKTAKETINNEIEKVDDKMLIMKLFQIKLEASKIIQSVQVAVQCCICQRVNAGVDLIHSSCIVDFSCFDCALSIIKTNNKLCPKCNKEITDLRPHVNRKNRIPRDFHSEYKSNTNDHIRPSTTNRNRDKIEAIVNLTDASPQNFPKQSISPNDLLAGKNVGMKFGDIESSIQGRLPAIDVDSDFANDSLSGNDSDKIIGPVKIKSKKKKRKKKKKINRE